LLRSSHHLIDPNKSSNTFGDLSLHENGLNLFTNAGNGGLLKIGLEELPDNFRVVLRKPFFKKLLLEGKSKTGLWKELARTIRLDYTSLVDLRNGETKSISLAVLKTLVLITKIPLEEAEKNCLFGYRSWGKPIRIPINPSPELASLVAHALGDGSIGERSFQVEYKNNNFECMKDVLSAVKKVFGVNASSRNEKNALVTTLPAAVGQVLFLAGATKGNKTKKDFDVPEWIKNGTRTIKQSFLRALFDDEGSVYIGKKSSNIKLYMGKLASKKDSLVKFLNSIRQMLEDFGIKSRGVITLREYRVKNQEKLMLGFWITGKRNLKLFAKKIGLNTVKQKKLEMAISSYKYDMWGEEVEDEILRVLCMEGPKKTSELVKGIARDRTSLLKHLHRLEANKKISSSRYELANGLYGFRWYTNTMAGGEENG